MAKFLLKVSYTAEGVKRLLKDGGSARRTAVEQMAKDLGGKLETFYYAFGQPDVYLIVDLPDAVTVSAVSLAINAAGLVCVSTTPLITPEEIDAACKKSAKVRVPGT